MGDLIDINKNKPPKKEAIKVFLFGKELDDLIKKHIVAGSKPIDVLAVLANRLGYFLSRFKAKKEIFPRLVRIISNKAELEE